MTMTYYEHNPEQEGIAIVTGLNLNRSADGVL